MIILSDAENAFDKIWHHFMIKSPRQSGNIRDIALYITENIQVHI